MPDFLVSAATGALGPVVNKLAALLSDEYKRFKGVRGEVKFLIRELEAMHAFLLKKSEEENPDVQDKVWMKEVRELSYDIEDSLDDFRVRVDDDLRKPDGFIDKCKNLLKKTKARHQIAKAIQDLKVQVKEVSERNARYKQTGDTVRNTSKVRVDPRALAIFEDASRLVGIDQPKREVISFLKEDGGISSQQPKIVSIVGIGGLGKTTLANRVYQEMKDQFECRAFLSVSRSPDMAKIFRTILSQVTGQRYWETEAGSIQQLIMEISEFLQTKRYLIVVDDVWDMKTWEAIKHALRNNNCGSVIITTTRIHDVAKACCSLYPGGWVYQPKPLQEHDSKRLFENRIFGLQNECPENLKEVSDKILKKCGGLPLAIIAISSLLANKAWNGVHSKKEWDQVQTSIGHGLERTNIVEGMLEILSLSYLDLPHHLKACLLYLSIFPEDYCIDKERLVQLWVAEGFISDESKCTLYESGEKSFNELINTNLILPGNMNEWTGEVNTCRLHDTILDFIVWKSSEENFVTVHVHGIPRLAPPPRTKVRRLSLQGKTEGDDATLHSNQNYANVRSIIYYGFPCSLLGYRFLRVLDFAGRLLENHHLANIGELLHLRYLGLRGTRITELPEQIGLLQYLETLDLRGCRIYDVSRAIVLRRLISLWMPDMVQDCFPSGIKNMHALEQLNEVKVYMDIKEAATFVEEIGDLTKMSHLGILIFSKVSVFDGENYVDLIKKMVSSFQRLNKLQTLGVQMFFEVEKGYAGIVDDIILEVPWCSASLRRLAFRMTPMSRVPSWMNSLVNIEELELIIKKLDQESFCILGDLPVLVVLTLEIEYDAEDIPSIDKQQLLIANRYGFKSLRNIIVVAGIGFLDVIPMLMFEAGSMPKLEQLRINFNADITIYVTNGHLDFGLKHLSQLKDVWCGMYGIELNILRVEAAIEKALGNHPNLPRFQNSRYSTEGERSNRERLRPRRRSHSTVHITQPKACFNREQKAVRALADDVVICSSGGDVKTSSSTTDLSFTIHHHGASPAVKWRRPDLDRELVEGAPVIPDRVKGTSADLSEQLVVQEPTDDAVVCTSSGDVKTSSSTTYDSTCQSLTAALQVPTDLSFTIHHHGTSLDIGRRHRQHRRHPKAHKGATIHGRVVVQCAPVIPDSIQGTSGAAPTSDVLGPRLNAAPQQQGAFVLPCFTFSSGLPPNAEAEQQAMDSDELVHVFSSTFNGLSLHNDHPGSGSSATSVNEASSDTGSLSYQGGGRQEQQ